MPKRKVSKLNTYQAPKYVTLEEIKTEFYRRRDNYTKELETCDINRRKWIERFLAKNPNEHFAKIKSETIRKKVEETYPDDIMELAVTIPDLLFFPFHSTSKKYWPIVIKRLDDFKEYLDDGKVRFMLFALIDLEIKYMDVAEKERIVDTSNVSYSKEIRTKAMDIQKRYFEMLEKIKINFNKEGAKKKTGFFSDGSGTKVKTEAEVIQAGQEKKEKKEMNEEESMENSYKLNEHTG